MPQGLTRTSADAGQPLQAGGRTLAAAHEQIAGVLRARLGQNHAELLATPRPGADGSIAWSTNLAGTVTPAAQLPEPERAKLQQRAERFASEILALAQQMRSEGPASAVVAQMLEQALQQPPGDWLYGVDGRPVRVLWGHAAPGTPVAAVAPVAAAAPLAASTPAAAMPAAMPAGVPPVVPPPAAATPPSSGGGWKRWLLWALLLLVLLYLLFFAWKRCSEVPAAADAGLAEQIAAAEARNKALEDELAAKRNAKPLRACVVDPVPPAASAPEPPASAPEPPASTPPPPPPKPDLKQRIAEAGKDCKALAAMLKNEPELKGNGAQANALKQQILGTMAKNCRDEAIKEAKNMCPGQRPKELAPDMAIVFDASGSMDFSVDVSDAQIRQQAGGDAVEALMRQLILGGRGGNPNLERFKREPKRITVAKRAALGVVQRLPSDLNTGLVLVDQCPQARSMGMYGPSQRGALMGQIQGIEPRAGTPLADGIEKGGALVDGVTKDSTIVIISDGVESCGRDPCAVAAALKRAKPRLKINVVDITGTGAGNCAAQITGGRVFTARNAAEVVEQMNRATQDAMGPANCQR